MRTGLAWQRPIKRTEILKNVVSSKVYAVLSKVEEINLTFDEITFDISIPAWYIFLYVDVTNPVHIYRTEREDTAMNPCSQYSLRTTTEISQ